MKKYFILITLAIFLVTQSAFALVIKTKSVPSYRPTSTPGEFGVRKGISTATTTPSGIYKACVGKKAQELTKEMQNKKKQALSNFKEAYNNATTTEAKKEIKKTYTHEIKEINKWFNQELRRVKTECKQLRVPTSTPTPTTTTSTQ